MDVTAITPTPLGEGKSTTTIGLVQGLARRGLRSSAAIRQPSGGPTMGMKGSAAGGGLSQCIPLTPYSLNFTGDIHAVGAAHNLAMTALTARMQHERNYDDATLARLSGMRRLNVDPTRVGTGWVMDFCAQALRNVIIGIEGDGRRNDGFMMRSHFDITVASEIMAVLCLADSLTDLNDISVCKVGTVALSTNAMLSLTLKNRSDRDRILALSFECSNYSFSVMNVYELVS